MIGKFIVTLRDVCVVSTVSLLLSACTVGPDYQPAIIALPDDWQTAPAAATATATTAAAENPAAEKNASPSAIRRNWWKSFNDPVLDNLIETARMQNLDLRTASERIREARAYVDRADAEQMPELSVAGGAARRSDQSGWSNDSINTRNSRLYEAGFDTSWEIDLFGGLRRQSEARSAELQAAIASRDDVELSLLAEVARTYIEYRLAEYDLQLAIRTLAAQEKTARITEARYQQGVDGRLEVERARVALANTRVRQPVAKASADAARFQLGFLLAKSPAELESLLNPSISAKKSDEIKALPIAELDVVLESPVAVIASRPDVRIAERQLAAATAQQGVAVAARYPRLTISGLLGFNADSGDRLYGSESKLWSLSADVLLPLIDFGRRRADIAAADAQQAQALLNYERTVRSALAEIDTALSAYIREREKLATYSEATIAARNAWIIAVKQYREGILPQLDVLISQRTLFDAELNEAQSRAELAARLIALNKSLGRGIEKNSEAQG